MSHPVAQQLADDADVISAVFLRLIKMIIAPLVFSTLASGVAGTRGHGSMRRMGISALVWFTCASLLSLALGLASADLLQPGKSLALSLPPGNVGASPALDGRSFLVHVVPASLFDAMARNDILQIVVFALLFGVALASLPEASVARVTAAVTELVQIMLRITHLVMRLAPFAVFASLFAATGRSGLGIVVTFGTFIVQFYATACLFWMLLIGTGLLLLGRSVFLLLRLVSQPFLLAFGTASSEAAFPLLIDQLEKFDVPRRISGFVLPLGYAFNLDGSMLFQSFAALFIAQAYGIAMSLPQQVTMLLVLMVSSKGTAGVPRAAIISLTAVLPTFGLPEAGLLLIFGIDHFLDMARSGTNIIGNAIATAVVARWNPDQE